jgi:UDP-N-acetylmuramate: L-alanyl-gamma-D-glutamyl-meso-diaminopimelate ligase
MWHYLPKTAVVTNVEFDHADIYRDETAYRFAFERFVNLVPSTGALVLGWEGDLERTLAKPSFAPVHSFGVGDHHGSRTHPRWVARDVHYGSEVTSFTLLHAGIELGRFDTPLAGAFNVRNCLAAVAAARAVEASWEGIREGLETFKTVRRRMEVRGSVGGVTVIDDFAHHPTAVRETLAAVRQRYPHRRLVAVFEPRNYTSQRREFQALFRAALAGADRVVLAGLFRPERYDETTGMDPSELVEGLRVDGVDASYVPQVDDIVTEVVSRAEPGDVVLVMSNGGFGGIHGKLLDQLEARGRG